MKVSEATKDLIRSGSSHFRLFPSNSCLTLDRFVVTWQIELCILQAGPYRKRIRGDYEDSTLSWVGDLLCPQASPPVTTSQRSHKRPVATAVSEITITEFLNSICTYRRKTEPEYSGCDQEWYQDVRNQVMEWIRSGDLEVLSTEPGLFRRGMNLVEDVTREFRRNFRCWDATHTVIAVDWARQIHRQVRLVSLNGDFGTLLELYPAFGRFIRLDRLGES